MLMKEYIQVDYIEEDFDSKNSAIYAISDLHIFHKNILTYNFDTRKKYLPKDVKKILIWKDDKENKKILNDYIESLDLLEKFKLLFKTSEWIINFLIKDVKEFYEQNKWKTLYYIDLWDFFFHINESKINILLNEWKSLYKKLHKFFDLLQELWFQRYLILWNHDNFDKENIRNFYYEFFDIWTKSLCMFDKKNKKINVFTHVPLWTWLLIDWYHEERKLCKWLDKAILQRLTNFKNYEITSYYWHTHDKYLFNRHYANKHNIEIDYSDYENKKSEDDKLVDFMNNNVELKLCCFDYKYSKRKAKDKHIENL